MRSNLFSSRMLKILNGMPRIKRLNPRHSNDNNKLNEYDYYAAQTKSLYSGIQSFAHVLKELHSLFDRDEYPDWPTVLLSTILQTTVVSFFKLLPLDVSLLDAIDRRSIATLLRNIIDTHDVLDLLCNPKDKNEYQLHRNIMGYYLAAQIHSVQRRLDRPHMGKMSKGTQTAYWNKLTKSSLSKKQLQKIKSAKSLFYATRSERIQKISPEYSEILNGIISDLSTYVHSVPPVLWLSTISEGFDNTPDNRNMLTVWLQVVNFYFAKSILIVLKATSIVQNEKLKQYTERHDKLFATNK